MTMTAGVQLETFRLEAHLIVRCPGVRAVAQVGAIDQPAHPFEHRCHGPVQTGLEDREKAAAASRRLRRFAPGAAQSSDRSARQNGSRRGNGDRCLRRSAAEDGRSGSLRTNPRAPPRASARTRRSSGRGAVASQGVARAASVVTVTVHTRRGDVTTKRSRSASRRR